MRTKDITFVIVTFHSEKVIFDCLDSLPEDSKKIIIENSNNFNLKDTLEKKYTNIDVPIEISNIELKKDNDVPINSLNASINVTNSADYVNNDTVENKNVPMNENLSNEHEDESDGYFSFIDYSRLPKKEDISIFFLVGFSPIIK